MRLELPDGQWAELRERLNYGPARDVRRAFVLADVHDGFKADVDLALVKAYVSNWNVLSAEGTAVPIETPENANDLAIQKIAAAALEVWNDQADPKDGSATSPSGLRALG